MTKREAAIKFAREIVVTGPKAHGEMVYGLAYEFLEAVTREERVPQPYAAERALMSIAGSLEKIANPLRVVGPDGVTRTIERALADADLVNMTPSERVACARKSAGDHRVVYDHIHDKWRIVGLREICGYMYATEDAAKADLPNLPTRAA